jgi:hypothetical protein
LRFHGPGDEGLETAATQLPASVPLAVGGAVALDSDAAIDHEATRQDRIDRAAPGFGRQHVAHPPAAANCRAAASRVLALDNSHSVAAVESEIDREKINAFARARSEHRER